MVWRIRKIEKNKIIELNKMSEMCMPNKELICQIQKNF